MKRTVHLTNKHMANTAEHKNDDGNGRHKNANCMQSEFMGGEHDADDEAGIDEEELLQNAPSPLAKLNLDAARSILQRDQEIAAASKKGRHRDADVQMKSFAAKFREQLTSALPP